VAVVEYCESESEDVMAAEEELEVFVALDSGAVTHIFPKDAMPAGTQIQKNAVERTFVAANGGEITNYGTAHIELVSEEDRHLACQAQVADITRPLHATGQICDTNKEILHTAKGAVVVPGGALSRYLKHTKVLAKYPRKGGLYMAKYKIRAPKRNTGDKQPGFTRQGTKR
jgi:hypothetical protein